MNSENQIPSLPVLKHIGDLSDIRPVVIIDTREQEPLPISRLPTFRTGLVSGDYSFSGGQDLFAVERKSLNDLVSCCMGHNRERFERELHRLRGFRFKRLLIVGSRAEIELKHYRSAINPVSVLHTLDAWEIRYDLPIVFEPSPSAAACHVESWIWWFCREQVLQCNAILRHHS